MQKSSISPNKIPLAIERLEAHIRLEERVDFPLIEETLSKAALTELAARLEVKDAGGGVTSLTRDG